MANKLERLLFAQGGHCFFCQGLLPKSEASVEHLVALANEGPNGDENCVICCKAVNALLGSLALKDKLKAILLQPKPFQCPAGIPTRGTAPHVKTLKTSTVPAKRGVPKSAPNLDAVVDNLRHRKSARPATMKTLTSSIKALHPSMNEAQLADLIAQLIERGIVVQNATRISYVLSEKS